MNSSVFHIYVLLSGVVAVSANGWTDYFETPVGYFSLDTSRQDAAYKSIVEKLFANFDTKLNLTKENKTDPNKLNMVEFFCKCLKEYNLNDFEDIRKCGGETLKNFEPTIEKGMTVNEIAELEKSYRKDIGEKEAELHEMLASPLDVPIEELWQDIKTKSEPKPTAPAVQCC